MKQLVNSFSISGIAAHDAEVKTFTMASLARFPLAISRLEKNGEGTNRVTAYLQIECWRSGEDIKAFDLLKKGQHLTISGTMRPEAWVNESGERRCRVVMVANKVEQTPDKEEVEAEPATAED